MAQLARPKLVRYKHTLVAPNEVEITLPRKHPQVALFHAKTAVTLECKLRLGKLTLIHDAAAATLPANEAAFAIYHGVVEVRVSREKRSHVKC